jgi:hypothetical protein
MSIEKVAEFKHRPLNRPTRNTQPFRLLEIQPCNENSSQVQCTLHHSNLLTKPSFKALSYVWGDLGVKVTILLDSKRYEVTRNCHGALLRLRELGETRVWIDAICIDQTNNEEKAAQIPLMNYIYPVAKEVIVWLGHIEGERDSNAQEIESMAISLLEDLSVEEIRTFDTFLEIAQSGEHPELRWKALSIIFGHIWFTRLWTHQELILSTNAMFVMDYHTLQFNQLRLATEVIHRSSDQMSFRQLPSYINEVFKDYSGFRDGLERARGRTLACVNRRNPLPWQKASVLGHVNMGRLFKCYEPRDRVYGILGLLDSDIRERIPVDYSKPVEQVYTEFTKLIIESSRSLEVLVRAGLCRGPSPCPTWVQDWSLLQSESNQPRPLTYSSYSACCSIRPTCSMIRDNFELSIRGILVDSVLATATITGDDILADCSHHKSGARGLSTWKEHFSEYPTGCDPLHAWIRTVTADMDGTEITAGRLCPEDVEAYSLEHRFWESTREEQLLVMPAVESEKDQWISWILGISHRFHLAVIAASVHRTFFISKTGYMGMGPVPMEEGDLICVALACNVPLMLRKYGNYYFLVGECFVWGLMDGEAMRDKKLRHRLETFCLR